MLYATRHAREGTTRRRARLARGRRRRFHGEREGPFKGWVSRDYEGFLELPVTIVLAVLWLAGLVLIGLFVLALHLVWLLLRLGAGA
jgi:hypothetical protein